MASDRSSHRTEGRAREDHHDLTAGVGGAAPARSALTLRLVLAGVGLVLCAAAAAGIGVAGGPAVIVGVFAALALIGVVDVVVVARRKRRGEPG